MYFNSETIVFLNGEWLSAQEASAGMYNQTMHYGCGVFEGIRAYKTPSGTHIFKAEEHYNRLRFSTESLHASLPFSTEELIELSYQLLEKNKLEDAYLRPLVFMGPNMSLQTSADVNLFLCAWEWGAYLGDNLLRVKTSPYERPNPKSCHVEAKVNGHYVNSILATNEAKKAGYDEALLNDINGHVAEGPGANFFFEKDGKLCTPPAGNILPGITRATIMDLAKEMDIELVEQHFYTEEIYGSEGAFFVGTAAEVIGFDSLDDHTFSLDWKDTHGFQLAKAYRSLVRRPKNQLAQYS